MTPHELSLRFNASSEVRRMGGLMTILWNHSLPQLRTLAGSSQFDLRTDRARGKLYLVLGHRVIPIFNVAVTADVATIEVDAVGKKDLPGWLNEATLNNISTATMASERWS